MSTPAQRDTVILVAAIVRGPPTAESTTTSNTAKASIVNIITTSIDVDAVSGTGTEMASRRQPRTQKIAQG
ncbi:hypothetical protein FOQG_05956 [Fusarium oxysporum f. sp. raphani 54005]|uniref:Uncharacterized protein n=2 Tax=Fusarium oxysporum TaxID=5507 RepID=X0CC08_FUSOX|nr:hypothetical protein FOVG_06879 [Fusarium oxysporum f. sp. pisi HDV247]EXK91970.1 hypothetical protein FOQG_05956 [Fusarium oxysporum f. sp. raphani 54005]